MRSCRACCILISLIVLCVPLWAQQTNPVDRQVSNPITDTPNINPISPEKSVIAPDTKKPKDKVEPEGGDGEVVVYSDRQSVEGAAGHRVVTHEGSVDVHYGIYRLQADKVVIYEAENKMVATGNVIFDKGNDERITGTRSEWNYKTKLGWFEDATGFTNQTNDGTVLYFTAERVERISLTELRVTNAEFTACDEAEPKWSFSAKSANIKTGDRAKLKHVKFKVKNVPLLALPFASIPLDKEDRKSGFLTPAFGFSPTKGVQVSGAYFLTLGRSADITFRGDIYTSRGFGYGAELRTRSNSRSYFNIGFFAVKDRVFGASADRDHPDQGGSTVYAEGVQYFPNGFTASADIRVTSNLAFRQVFLEGIQQIISPIERSQIFVNKSWTNYTMNVLARSQVISIPNVRVKTRNLPSISFEKRPSRLSFFKNAYFSFKSSLEGVSRREEVDDIGLYRRQNLQEPTLTPAIMQRFDVYPEFTVPIYTKYFNVTASASARVTYYSNSLDYRRNVISTDLIRKYGQFTLDIRPVALARNFYGKENKFKFRHVIEPFLTYRFVKGVDNFNKIIRFDYIDTITNTNELEYGITNRFYTRRYSEALTKEAQKRLRDDGESKQDDLSIQPYEIFSVTVRGKYFFDKTFGGALVAGRRNQIEPITALSFYSFGGAARRFSPINIDATYRPQKTVFVSTRMDWGLYGDGLRDISATVGYDTKMFKLFQTLYYTRRVTLIPSLAQYARPDRSEPGTLRGAQWSPSIFVGNRDKGPYGGASLFFDFENRRAANLNPLISSLYTIGYAYDCCSMALQYYTFNVGARRENKVVFSFRLNGIGSFGTEQFAQGLR